MGTAYHPPFLLEVKMINADFAYEQNVTTVPSMSHRERAQAKHDISEDFARFYRDNYFRFSEMYDGSITIQDRDIHYAEMLPVRVLAEMAIPS
jgi:hypothetical protein